MNILLTCAGRRSYMVDYFKEALGSNGNVYAVNSTAEATSMLVADGAFVAPTLYEKEYVIFLKRICREYKIKLLVSLFDLELPVLAKHKSEFENIGVTMAVSSPEVIATCNDKLKTIEFGEYLNIKTLFTTIDIKVALKKVKSGSIHFPLYIKPRWGMGSLAMQIAENEEELQILLHKVKRDLNKSYLKYYDTLIPDEAVIIQEKADGQEYGLDVVNDFDGNYVTTFVKRKLAMRSGETDGAVTENIPELLELGEKIGNHLGHIGNLDVDVFWNGKEPVILEMNTRFGGGYPFSHLAGADIPKAYVEWANGNSVSDDCFAIELGVKGLKELSVLSSRQINLLSKENYEDN